MSTTSFAVILPYTRNAEMLSQLLGFLAISSIVIWFAVFASTIIKIVICKFYQHSSRNINE